MKRIFVNGAYHHRAVAEITRRDDSRDHVGRTSLISWGIGCFHFGLRAPPTPCWTLTDYQHDLTRALRGVSAVDTISVDIDPEFADRVINFTGPPPNIGNGDGPFPYITFGTVEFDLLIPAAVQSELLRTGDALPPTFSERFRVSIEYQFRFPVAAIRPINPTQRPVPSQAVIVVRRLLEREFERLTASRINFQMLGPSPFHAEFHLLEGAADPDGSDLECRVIRPRGYDEYEFRFNPALLAGPEEAYASLLHSLCSEADVFYLAHAMDTRRIHGWSEIQDNIENVIAIQRAPGAKAWFSRAFRTGRAINDAFIALTEFEVEQTFQEDTLRADFRGTYSTDVRHYIRERVEEARDELMAYPSQQMVSLLRLFETRRLSGLEVTMLLVSGLLGGAVGAILALVVG